MGKSEDLMKGIDRVGIFERMKDYEDMAFETRAIDVGNDSGRSAMPFMRPSQEILIRDTGILQEMPFRHVLHLWKA